MGYFGIFIISIFISASVNATIYGVDSRQEIERATDEIQTISKMSVAQFTMDSIKIQSDKITVHGPSYSKYRNLCSGGSPFEFQTAVASCSGILLSDHILLTAGHCISDGPRTALQASEDEETPPQCSDSYFAVGFKTKTNSLTKETSEIKSFSKNHMSKCKHVLKRRIISGNSKLDYAIVELETPLPFEKGILKIESDINSTQLQDFLLVLGYPNGIPMKLAEGQVTSINPNENFVLATTDTFERNSGSPVFLKNSLHLVGLLIAGGVDIEQGSTQKFCIREKYVKNPNIGQEKILTIDSIRKDLPKNLAYLLR